MGLPERRRPLVVRRQLVAVELAEVGEGSLGELLLVHALPDPLCPDAELAAQAPEVVVDALDDAEVDEREP